MSWWGRLAAMLVVQTLNGIAFLVGYYVFHHLIGAKPIVAAGLTLAVLLCEVPGP